MSMLRPIINNLPKSARKVTKIRGLCNSALRKSHKYAGPFKIVLKKLPNFAIFEHFCNSGGHKAHKYVGPVTKTFLYR